MVLHDMQNLSGKTVRNILKLAAFGSVLLLPTQCFASDSYPNRPLKIVVPFAPGGIVDAVARLVSERLSNTIKFPVLVENRPGAGSITGSASVAHSEPDGYTILFGSVANVTQSAIQKKLPYDIKADLSPICRIVTVPNYLVVGADSPFGSLRDVVSAAKARPDELTFASTGYGTTPHLAAELLKIMAGIKITHVPYTGSGPAYADLIPGRVTMMFDSAALAQIRAGKVRALAVTSPKRSIAAPSIPTVSEAGVPGFSIVPWLAVWVPKKTPTERISLLKANLQAILAEPIMQQKIIDLGGSADVLCEDEFETFIGDELSKWQKLSADAEINRKE